MHSATGDLSDVELAIAAAQAGATTLRAKYGVVLSRYAKSATDFATDADLEAENAIMQILRADRPDDQFVGEEGGATGDASSTRTWLVDPLCGTLNFAAQTPLVAVNVALRSGTSVVAAVADPFAQELFWTDGAAAYLRSAGRDEPLVPTAESRLVEFNLDSPFPNGDRFRVVRLLADPAFTDTYQPRVLSTTLALTWVAAGRRAAFVTDGRLRDSVHFAAGIALCEAAGCVVTNLRGEPVHTGVEGLVAAADASTHAALIELIDRQFG